MPEQTTLLAHLVPRMTSRIEDTATDALAFILNKSEGCRNALNQLLQQNGSGLQPLVRFRTQVTYEDGSRPDMDGYDRSGAKRLLVESKFWASLLQGQASEYFEQLTEEGPGMLLFVAPEGRLETLWGEIKRQMSEAGREFEELTISPHRCRIINSEKRLMLVSWTSLLDHLLAAVPDDARVASDIRQLRGLSQREDDEAFLPIHLNELSPSLPRRIRAINDLIDNVIRRGRQQLEMTTRNLRRTSQREGYGRYFRFIKVPGDLFLCVNTYLWATSADTPLWLWIGGGVPIDADKLREKVPSLIEYEGYGTYDVPIYLKAGVESQAVLDDVMSQIEVVKNHINGID